MLPINGCRLACWRVPFDLSSGPGGCLVSMTYSLINSRRELYQKSSSIELPPPLRGKPPGRLLDNGAQCEQGLLVERTADELQPERQPFGRQAAGNGHAGQPRHVHRHREHVVEIHLDRIAAALLADAEGG